MIYRTAVALLLMTAACDPPPASAPAPATPVERNAPPQAVTPAAETLPPFAAPGKVVVRQHNGEGRAYVRCFPGERLVGGGCGGGGCRNLNESYPDWFGRDDAEGAGWQCNCGATSASGVGATAFALCQGLERTSDAGAR